MPSPEESSELSPAAEAFAEYLARTDAGERVDFEAFCAERPRVAPKLRRLHARFAALSGLLAPDGPEDGDPESAPSKAGSRAGKRSRGTDRTSRGTAEILALLRREPEGSARLAVRGEVGRGGTARVVEVWDRDFDRALAMKVPLERGQDSFAGSRGLSRFLEEARIVGQLEHPGILPVHELGVGADGRPYFTMPLVRGESLREVFRRVHAGEREWTRERALGLLVSVCETVAYAHSRGVLHRDLKPANVMVGRFGETWVLDWGLARAVPEDGSAGSSSAGGSSAADGQVSDERVRSLRRAEIGEESPLLTVEGDVVGTPAYMAPEQARGELGTVGPAADVYAIGAMLYELCGGESPCASRTPSGTVAEVLAEVESGPPPPLWRIAPDVPPELAAVCDKAMARTPAERYANPRALADDLRAFLELRVVRAYRTGPWVELGKWVRRNRALAGASAAAVLALVAGLAVGSVLFARARANERLATQRAEDVLRLSASSDLRELVREADGLWPPHPARVPELEDWLARAEALLADLPRHRAQLEELRTHATESKRPAKEREIVAHARLAELEDARRVHAAALAALRQRRDGVELEIPRVSPRRPIGGVQSLIDYAVRYSGPEREAYGREARAASSALSAVALARGPSETANAQRALAWAYFDLGRDAEALRAADEAWAAAPPALADEIRAFRAELSERVDERSGAEGIARAEREVVELAERVAALEDEVLYTLEQNYPEEHRREAWWDGQLTALVAELERLDDRESGLLSPDFAGEHGWSIPHRLAFARELAARAASTETAEQWERAARDVAAEPRYRAGARGLELAPQTGLVPLGRDPRSGLLELAHLASGEPPVRGADGALVLEPESAIVLVLVPGGAFEMGCQSESPDEPGYDPDCVPMEAPPHAVELAPFLIGKHEVTQSQWLRLAGENPSFYEIGDRGGDARIGPTHPVEELSWWSAREMLSRFGLELPTEAQWEYGCRAGTRTVFAYGDTPADLAGAANIADEGSARHYTEGWKYEPGIVDGYDVHAPIGSFAPNAFGLHDVHGNVWEWCEDRVGTYWLDVEPGSGLRRASLAVAQRVCRGGSYFDHGKDLRSARRLLTEAVAHSDDTGARAARALEP